MPKDLEIDASAHGGSVVLARGQGLAVTLDENPTTGYRWSVETLDGLRLVDDRFTPASAGIGAGGQRRINLQASAPGTHRLVLLHRRTWEPAANALARVELNVTASP